MGMAVNPRIFKPPAPEVEPLTEGLSITIDLQGMPNARCVSLRVAKFGGKFLKYDRKTKRLVNKGGKAIPCKDLRKLHIHVALPSSTYFAVNYRVYLGNSWSKCSDSTDCFTLNNTKPPPPKITPLPGRLGVTLPRLPPNAQHLTLWIQKNPQDHGPYHTYDYASKKVVATSGRAIPVWDTGRYFEIKLDPETDYAVKYSLMQNGKWNAHCEEIIARTLPELTWKEKLSCDEAVPENCCRNYVGR